MVPGGGEVLLLALTPARLAPVLVEAVEEDVELPSEPPKTTATEVTVFCGLVVALTESVL